MPKKNKSQGILAAALISRESPDLMGATSHAFSSLAVQGLMEVALKLGPETQSVKTVHVWIVSHKMN